MTTPVVELPLSAPELIPAKKKRVLLLDTSQTKRDLRADVMRQLGIEVDCAADVLEARCWWRADLYNLVLISVAGETDGRDQFCTDIRGANPPQRIAFFVGGPSISQHCRILTKLQPNRGPMRCTKKWSLRSWPRLRAILPNAGESWKPAGRSQACAQPAKPVHARYGKRPGPRGGQKPSSSIRRAKSLLLSRYL